MDSSINVVSTVREKAALWEKRKVHLYQIVLLMVGPLFRGGWASFVVGIERGCRTCGEVRRWSVLESQHDRVRLWREQNVVTNEGGRMPGT